MFKKPAIECIQLKKVLGKKVVLQDIDLQIESGTILMLAGSNGAGKTTFIKILSTLLMPSGGRAMICGRDVTTDALQVKRLIGLVSSEERSFYWRLNGRQNLKFFASLYDLYGKKIEGRIDALLDAVGLEKAAQLPFREYSSGMKQALGIARAMLHDPPVLLLDEPTRSLSPDVAKRIRNLLKEKVEGEGKTVLIASHNMKDGEELADGMAILHKGTLAAVGTPTELKVRAGLPMSADFESLFEYFTEEQTIHESSLGLSLA